ncbi:MAG: ABC transporter substrate-binding protein [Rhodopirellula sp. JB044]|uniref:ABC transporter substrate-binding protein n=1 Tax=Rhodopirellula sp. JB044 TaxID=3342844 RepID=UPI00370A52DC
MAAMAGCRSQDSPSESAASRRRTDVPLRVVWVGAEADADVLKRSWASISEQPLDVRIVAPPRPVPDASGETEAPAELNLSGELFEKAAASDVLIYPVAMLSQLVSKKRIMPLLDQAAGKQASGTEATGQTRSDSAGDLETSETVFASEDRTTMPVGLRIATTFSSERLAIPVGGYLPALLLGEEANSTQETANTQETASAQDANGTKAAAITDWESYGEFVKSSDGKCCEPTAPTWAGAMYLWRLSSSLTATWLFERETLRPLLTEREYVAVLEQMQRAVQASVDAKQGRTPGEIYNAVASGELIAGIGFPQRGLSTDEDASVGGLITLASLPTGSSSRRAEQSRLGLRVDPSRGMVDPFMLVGSMAASCRQTAAADTFLQWLAGGEGSEPLYRNIGEFIDTKTAPSESSNDPFEQYRTWLSKKLSDANFVPTLQLIGAAEYYAALDKGVRECVHENKPARQACEEISERWSRLHRKFDLPAQQRNWRRAQGIS